MFDGDGFLTQKVQSRSIASLRNGLQRGFTLIEVLLVITVLAVVALFVVRGVREQASHTRLQKAAQEMQTMMQAVLYYEATHHIWPTDHDATDCVSELPSNEFTGDYMPTQHVSADDTGKETVFGTNYCWHGKQMDDETRSAAVFQLYLPVVGSHACRQARQIAGMLPNAQAVPSMGSVPAVCGDAKQYFVQVELVPPVSSSAAVGSENFRTLGRCYPDDSVETPECGVEDIAVNSNSCCHIASSKPTQYRIQFASCSVGEKPRVVFLPAYITYMHSKGSSHAAQTIFDRDYIYSAGSSDPENGRVHNPDPSCEVDDESGQTVCTLTLGVGMNTYSSSPVVDMTNPPSSYHPGKTGAVYMVSCVKQITAVRST